MAQFQKGQSGNPGGRRKADPALRDIARSHTAEAIKALLRVMRSKRSPAAAVVMAAREILDRGYGRPAQTMDMRGALSLEQLVARAGQIAGKQGADDDTRAG